jgi:hypothetical protein
MFSLQSRDSGLVDVASAGFQIIPLERRCGRPRIESTHGAGCRSREPLQLAFRSVTLHTLALSRRHNDDIFQTSPAGILLASLSHRVEVVLVVSIVVITNRYCQACGRLPCMLHDDEPCRSKQQAPLSNLIKFS